MITATALTTTASITWRIPSFTTQEQYYIVYGADRNTLDQQSGSVSSVGNTTLTNQEYTLSLSGLEPGTIYYLRVVAVFDMFSKRQSEIFAFRTKENGKHHTI